MLGFDDGVCMSVHACGYAYLHELARRTEKGDPGIYPSRGGGQTHTDGRGPVSQYEKLV